MTSETLQLQSHIFNARVGEAKLFCQRWVWYLSDCENSRWYM